jgi:hypothetical protein
MTADAHQAFLLAEEYVATEDMEQAWVEEHLR